MTCGNLDCSHLQAEHLETAPFNCVQPPRESGSTFQLLPNAAAPLLPMLHLLLLHLLPGLHLPDSPCRPALLHLQLLPTLAPIPVAPAGTLSPHQLMIMSCVRAPAAHAYGQGNHCNRAAVKPVISGRIVAAGNNNRQQQLTAQEGVEASVAGTPAGMLAA